MTKYTRTEFHALFPTQEEALKYSQDPFFLRDGGDASKPVQDGDLEWMVWFYGHHAPENLAKYTERARELIESYGGVLDGEKPAAEVAEEDEAATL